ncbi:Thoeris anti-defense Tad2 family protein [Moraxella bovis]|nr:MW1434 family type I TA system toxin [Moraxella bovis]
MPYRAYLALKTAQNDVATWTPSVSDTLAEDWVIVE